MEVIVVASSEGGIQESLRMLLGEEHMLVPARTLPQLLNAVVERPVDAVIIDEFLESADCVSIFRRLRSLSPDVTCIMLTVQTNSDMVREMRAKGIYEIGAKPFDKDMLIASVERALERSRLLKKVAAARAAPSQAAERTAPREVSTGEPSIAQRREMVDSLRKFLKVVGVTSQQEIEKAIRAAVADGRLKGSKTVEAQMVLTIGKVGLNHKVDGKIELE